MKKEFFFFNLKTLDPIFLKKIALTTLPIKYLIRYSNLKTKIILVDSFSFFFTFKLLKKNFFNSQKINIKKKKLLSEKKNVIWYKKNLKKYLIGSSILLNNKIYTNKDNFKFSFIYFKQKLNLKNIAYLFKFLEHLNLLIVFKNKIAYLKKKKLKRGLIKYYFSGILLFKRKSKKKKELKKELKKNFNIFFLQRSLLNASNTPYTTNWNQNYLLATKKTYFLTFLYNLNTIYSRKLIKIKIFSLRKKIYKKDFRHTAHLSLKAKRRYVKQRYYLK